MKKLFVAMVAMSALLLFVNGAEAQTTEKTESNTFGGLTFDSPERAQCVSACFENPTAVEKKSPKKRARKANKKRACPPCCDVLKKHIKELRTEIELLTNQVGLLGKKDADFEARIAELEKAVQYVENAMDENTYFIAILTDEVEGLRSRIEKLEAISDPINVGPEVGFIWLGSGDGTTFSAVPVGIQIDLRFSEHWKIGADLALAFSIGDRPFSSIARGFVGIDLPKVVTLEIGFSSVWASWNKNLRAHSAFFLGDVGIGFRLYKGLKLSANVYLGQEYDKGGPAMAGGISTSMGYMF